MMAYSMYYPYAPWCWHIYQHLPEQNHPVLKVNIPGGDLLHSYGSHAAFSDLPMKDGGFYRFVSLPEGTYNYNVNGLLY